MRILNLLLIVGGLLLSCRANAQVHFYDDFNSGTDGHPPTGWTLGDGGTLKNNGFPTGPDTTWVIQTDYWGDDLGDGKFVFIKYSFNGTQNDTITTPNINLSGVTTGKVILSFISNYQDWSTSNTDSGLVEVFNGANWVKIDTFNADEGNWAPNTLLKEYDVSPHALGNANFKVRFIYFGDDDMYWAIDQVKVFSPPPYDVRAEGAFLVDSMTGCDNVDTLAVAIKNVGGNDIINGTIDFYYEVVGSGSVTGPITVSNYSLAVGRTDTVYLTSNPFVFNGSGQFKLKVWAKLTSNTDGDATNDSTYTPNYEYYPPTSAYPVKTDFTGYDGSNLPTISPGWYEASGPWKTFPSAGFSSWTNDNWLNSSSINGTSARVNLFSNSKDGEWIISPKVVVPNTNAWLWYDIGVTDYGKTVLTDSLGSDDSVLVAISTDCGYTWSMLRLYKRANTPPATGITEYIDLSSYAGQTVQIGFYATEGTFNDTTDIDVFLDNINIGQLASNDVGVVEAWLKDNLSDCSGKDSVVIRIKNFGTADQTSIPVKYQLYKNGSAVGSPVSGTATGNLQAFGGTLVYTFPTPVNATSSGDYTVKAWTELTGDANNQNDTATSGVYPYYISAPTNASPFVEDFETFKVPDTLMNGWYRIPNPVPDPGSYSAPYRWRVWSGSTPSTGTGPSSDHTTGSNTGKYMYTEASGSNAGDVAMLYSGCIDIKNMDYPYITWWYHLFGADIDSLIVEASNDGKTWTVLKEYKGAVGDMWKMDGASLNAFAGDTIRIRFRGVRGPDFKGDMAIDDINIFSAPDGSLVKFLGIKDSVCEGSSLSFETLVTSVNQNYKGRLEVTIGSDKDTLPLPKPIIAQGDTDTVAYTYTFNTTGQVPITVILLHDTVDASAANDTLRDTVYVVPLPSFTLTNVDTVTVDSLVCFGTGFAGADSTIWSAPNEVQIDSTYGAGDSAICVTFKNITIFPDTQYVCAKVYKNGCYKMECDTFIVKDAPSKIANSLIETVSIYPNPVKDVINISVYGSARVTLYDVKGNAVRSQVIVNTGEIDVSNLSKGIYILRVDVGDAVRNFKIVKE